MNDKEIGELRRRLRPDRTNITSVYGCYVSDSREILSTFRQSLSICTEDDKELYLGLLKKALSGSIDKNLLDLSFRTQQVADSDEHRLLMKLRETKLSDEETLQTFYQTVIDSLSIEGHYLILLAHESYDVPFKARDGASLEDGDTVFSYILCAVCPVKAPTLELRYDHDLNEFHPGSTGHIALAPELGFLYPAFDNRAANIYNLLFYAKNPAELHQEVIDALFRVEPPMSAAEQKNIFDTALTEALDKDCSYDVVQSVHEQIRARIEDHKETHDPEPLELTVSDVGVILANSGVDAGKVEAFKENCEKQYGENAVLNPVNIIESRKFEVTTPEVKITIAPENSYMIETRVIDGRKYLLIPADDGVEVNGIGVSIAMPHAPEEPAQP